MAKRGLEERKIDIRPIDIMKSPPSKKIFRALISKYGAREMIRKNSKNYRELRVGKMKLSDNELAGLFKAHPDLASRPIILVNDDVYLTRDPELFNHLKSQS